MIQITSPAAASRKWLRISGGRILLPPSPSCRIPPRISQIESSTKPPPAVMTQVTSAAHFIVSPFEFGWSGLRPLDCIYSPNSNQTRLRIVVAARCLADDLRRRTEETRDQPLPQAVIELTPACARPHERPQWTGRRRDEPFLVTGVDDGRLKTGAAKGRARVCKCGRKCFTGPHSAREPPAVRSADLAQPARARERVDEQREQVFVAPPGQFERRQLRSRGVRLRRTAGAGAGTSRAAFELGDEEARPRQPFESATRHVAMDSLSGRELVRRHGLRAAANEEQRLAQSWIEKPVECPHGLSRYRLAGDRKLVANEPDEELI